MTYNVTALENTSGVDVIIGLNTATNGGLMMGVFVALAVIFFLSLRKSNDGIQAAWYVSIFFTILSAIFDYLGMVQTYLFLVFLGFALVLTYLNYQKGAS